MRRECGAPPRHERIPSSEGTSHRIAQGSLRKNFPELHIWDSNLGGNCRPETRGERARSFERVRRDARRSNSRSLAKGALPFRPAVAANGRPQCATRGPDRSSKRPRLPDLRPGGPCAGIFSRPRAAQLSALLFCFPFARHDATLGVVAGGRLTVNPDNGPGPCALLLVAPSSSRLGKARPVLRPVRRRAAGAAPGPSCPQTACSSMPPELAGHARQRRPRRAWRGKILPCPLPAVNAATWAFASPKPPFQ